MFLSDLVENKFDFWLIFKMRPHYLLHPVISSDDVKLFFTIIWKILLQTSEVLEKQKCYLETYADPVLLIQPVKVELVHRDPDIFILHGVMTERQIEEVKKIGMQRVERALVINPDNDEGVKSHTRVSKK